MKKLAILISLVFSLFMLVVPAVMAGTISAGDYVELTAYNSLDSAGIMTYAVSTDGGQTVAFYTNTFCIQDNVYVNPNKWYPVVAVSGNVGYFNTVPGTGPLNGAVDYLFYLYTIGNYNTLFTGLNGQAEQADFQDLLWSLQGSGSPYTQNTSIPTPWNNDLTIYKSNSSLQKPWGTEVINIVSSLSNGQDIQNQLYNPNPVPEPSAILLLGFGLVGLVGFGRKKFKK